MVGCGGSGGGGLCAVTLWLGGNRAVNGARVQSLW